MLWFIKKQLRIMPYKLISHTKMSSVFGDTKSNLTLLNVYLITNNLPFRIQGEITDIKTITPLRTVE